MFPNPVRRIWDMRYVIRQIVAESPQLLANGWRLTVIPWSHHANKVQKGVIICNGNQQVAL